MKKAISIILSALMMLSTAFVTTNALSTEGSRYEAKFVEYLRNYCNPESYGYADKNWYSYCEICDFSSKDNTSEEADCVLVRGSSFMVEPMMHCVVIGQRYFLQNCCSPDCLGYYIYSKTDDSFTSLEDMYKSDKDFTTKLVNEVGIGKLLGDIDNNNKLTVNDVTLLQKQLANIGYYTETIGNYFSNHPISDSPLIDSTGDINCDGKTDINDVTYMQYRVAELAE